MSRTGSRPSDVDGAVVLDLAGISTKPDLRPALTAVVRHLADSPADDLRLDDEIATRVARRARRDSMSGALLRAIDDDVVRVSPAVADAVRVQARTHLQLQLSLDALALEVSRAARELGVDLTFVKGVATSRLDHPRPTDRNYVDVDVLVRSDDHDRLTDVLVDRGFTLRPRGPADGPTFFKGSELFSQDGRGLDLHTRLFRQSHPHRDGWIDEREPFSIGSTELWAPSAPWRLVHAAGHLVLTPMNERKLNISVDVAALIRSGTDLEATLDRAARLHLAGVVAWGIAIGCRAAGVEVDLDLLDRHARGGPLRDRSCRWAFLDQRRRLGREQVPNLLGVALRDRPTLVRAFLFPSREYREYWHRAGAAGQLRYLARKLRGG